MIEEKDLIKVGKFLKTHALKGELNVETEIDPDIFDEEYPLIIPVEGIFVPFYIESYRRKGSFGSLIKLDGIDSVEDAKKFVNNEIYMLRRDVAEYFEMEEDELATSDEFVGYEVHDSHYGYIGKVVDVDDSTQNILLSVKPDNSDSLIYIPFAEEFVKDIEDPEDGKSGRIEMNLPEGILDLNE